MKKAGVLALVVFCFSVALTLFGCADSSKNIGVSKGPNLLEPASIFKFQDLPVPSGFKIIPQNSYSFECAGTRVGVLKYQGKANPDYVINFYKEQMPLYNWTLLNIVEYGDRLLNFDRENETCIVTILAKGNHVTLTLSFGPKPQGVKRGSYKPIK